MASRTMSPLRIIGQRLRVPLSRKILPFSQPQSTRTVVSTSKPRQYPQASTASKPPASSTSRTPPPASSSSSPASKPTASTSRTAAARTPIPAVSGTPLPDAPTTTSPYASNTNNSHNDADNNIGVIDWTRSYHGLGTSAFAPETAAALQAPLDPDDIEVKPDGIIYLPEIKYRRILNAAFGPGGWGLAPRAELQVHEKLVTREYALIVHGRFVAQARGEQQYFSEEGVSTAAEGCKSNAMMRCCKDLGVASELWDPRFIRRFMREHAVQAWVEHAATKKRKQIWLRRDDEVRYPWKKT